MKAKDLMIGSWVIAKYSWNYSCCPPETHQIDYQDYIWESKNEWPTVEYLPLPLTREILEKNDFLDSYVNEKLDKNEIYVWYDVYGHEVIVDMKSNNIKVKHDAKILLDLWYTEKVPVHELQLALKHCGINKEIAL